MILLRLFGHPVLERDGVRSPLGVPAKAIVLLALLCAHRLRPLSREWLAESLWPDAEPAESRTNLRRHLHLLAKALGEQALVLSRHTAQWNRAGGIEVDAIAFEELAETEPALAAGEYAGELCTGIDDPVLEELRLRYRSRFEALLQTLVARAQESGDHALLTFSLQRAIAHDPFDERAVRELMRLRSRSGDRAGAVREYTALAQRLRVELEVEPAAETTAVLREILEGESSAQTPNNLPVFSTTFVGREHELNAIARALQDHRIVTLAGTGGIGKTRLAVRTAATLLAAFPAGVFFVDAELARTKTGLWERIAAAAGAAGNDAEAAVLSRLQDARTLIVLDTCEHLPDEAREVSERLIAGTQACVLATSRRKLHARGEFTIPVSSLAIPPERLASHDSPLRYGAYRLFLERAVMSNPAFRAEGESVHVVCTLLHEVDGLPLAIELLASRADVLTLEGMRKRLATTMRARRRGISPEAGKSVEDALAWSWDLLDTAQRTLFARLSVMRAPFTLEDAEGLCPDLPEAADTLLELLDASLIAVRNDDGAIRYRLLETTRDFARQMLLERGLETEARDRHLQLFARKAAEIVAQPETVQAAAMESMAATFEEYLAALDRCTELADAQTGATILRALGRSAARRHFAEELLVRARALIAANKDPAQYAQLLLLLPKVLAKLARYQESLEIDEVAERYFRAVADRPGLREALTSKAVDCFHLGDYEQSERALREVLESAQADGDRTTLLKTRGRLAVLYSLTERLELLSEICKELRDEGHVAQYALAVRNLAIAQFFTGKYAEALKSVKEALAIPGARVDVAGLAIVLSLKGDIELEMHDVPAAVRSHGEVADLLPHLDDKTLCDCLEDLASTLAHVNPPMAARCLGYTTATRPRIPAVRDDNSERTFRGVERLLAGQPAARLKAWRTEGAAMEQAALLEAVQRAFAEAAGDNEVTTSLS